MRPDIRMRQVYAFCLIWLKLDLSRLVWLADLSVMLDCF
jgi:hypothetical protein